MFARICVLALLSSSAIAVPAEQRLVARQATDAAAYSSAASELVAQYVPESAFSILESSAEAAAASAHISYSDGASLVYDALLASALPDWFSSAIPEAYATEINALKGSIDELRGTVVAAPAPGPTLVLATTTDGSGNAVTTRVPASVTETTTVGGITTTTADIASSYASFTSTYTDSAGSTLTSVYSSLVTGAVGVGNTITSGAGSVGTQITGGAGSVGTEITSGAGSVGTQITGGAGSVGTQITSGAGSVATDITSGAGSVGTVITSGAGGVLSTITSGAGGVLSTITSGLAPTTTAGGGGAARKNVGFAGAVGVLGVVAFL